MNYFRRALRYLRPYRRLALLSVVLTVVHAGTALLAPWPLKILVDNVLGGQPLPEPLSTRVGSLEDHTVMFLAVVVGAGFVIAVLDGLVGVLSSYINTRIEQFMVLDLRSDLFNHALHLPMTFHEQRRAGGLVYGINYQASAAPALVMATLPLAQSVLVLVGMFWILLKIDWQLALVSLAVVPVLYFAVGYYATHIQQRLRRVKGLEGESLSIIHEALSMLRVIVSFGREPYEYRRFRDQGERAVRARIDVTVRQTVFSMVVSVTTAAGTALVLGIGALHVLQGTLTLGQLLVAIAYLASVYKPLEAISYTIGSLQDHLVSLQVAFNILDKPVAIQDPPRALRLERARGEILFDHVDFSYPNRPETLKDITFRAQAGQVVAIVGPTGAGKTTLVSLLPRLYQPTSGHIFLDGTDITELAVASLRDQLSLVLQEPLLFSGTIEHNIRYGNLDAPPEEIVAAARAANAHDFIERLPQRYETQIGEGGAQLSVGERQRICVARAFLRQAPILILDEPTASIDSRTESVILDALDRLMVGRTTLMIAHRLSTVRHADKILVISAGRIVQSGRHEELLDRDGLYRQLWDVQMGRNGHRGARTAVGRVG